MIATVYKFAILRIKMTAFIVIGTLFLIFTISILFDF